VAQYKEYEIDKVASIESRGFVIGAALACALNKGFVLIRKKGKLPFKTIEEEYEKEYGPDVIQMHKDAVKKGEKILLIDDLIATGNTAVAACNLVEKLGGEIVECGFIVELTDFDARNKKLKDYDVFALISSKEEG
jgi:adenine phosphoribosyltransferase